MRRGTPISFLLFSFFPLLIMQHIPAVQRSRDELNWSDTSTRTPSYHPTRGCTVECAVQLGKHTQVSRLPNEHTPQWVWAAALLGTGLHVTSKPEFTVPWYREDAVDLQQYQCVFPLPALSHMTQEYMLMIDASHRPIRPLSQTWLLCYWKIPFSKPCYMVTGEEGIVSDKGRCPDVTSQQPNR